MKINIRKTDFVIFDCDGVILNSNKIKTNAFKETLSKYPKDKVMQLINFHKKNGGISRKIKFDYFFKEILKENNQKLINDSLDQFKKNSFKKLIKSRYISGVLNFIKILHKYKIKIFIVSGAFEKELREIFNLRKKNHMFLEILGTPKNKEENIEYLFKKYSLENKNGLFFGDAETDYLVSKKFNIKFIFVSSESEWSDFKKIHNLLIIENFTNIECQF